MALFCTSTFAFCLSINVDFSHIVNYLKEKTSTTVHRLYMEALYFFTKTPVYVPAAELGVTSSHMFTVHMSQCALQSTGRVCWDFIFY